MGNVFSQQAIQLLQLTWDAEYGIGIAKSAYSVRLDGLWQIVAVYQYQMIVVHSMSMVNVLVALKDMM